MSDRSLWYTLLASPPIQYSIASVDYLFDGHFAAARALMCLYAITVATRIVAESRQSLIDRGRLDPKSSGVIFSILALEAWREGRLSLDTFYNKFLQRAGLWVVILLPARSMHDAYPVQGWTKAAVAFLLACELRAIIGNLGDCGIERARMIRQFIDQAAEAILKAKIQDLGRALMGLGGAMFGWGSGYQGYSGSKDDKGQDSAQDRRNGPKKY